MVRRGMTLVETLIACGSMVLIMGAMLSLLLTGRSLQVSADAYATQLQQVNRCLDRLEQDLRSVPRVTLQHADSGGTSVSGASNLSFPSCLDASGQVVTDASGRAVFDHWVVYVLRNNQLLRDTATDPTHEYTTFMPYRLQLQVVNGEGGEVVGRGISTFSFDTISLTAVQVDVSAVSKDPRTGTYVNMVIGRRCFDLNVPR